VSAQGLVLALGAGCRDAGAEPIRFLDVLLGVEPACASVCSPADASPEDLRLKIESLAADLRSGPGWSSDPSSRVQALNRLVFQRLKIRPSQDLKNPDNLFLSRVLERGQGYCVGIASLYLVLAERLGTPVFAVATPSHVFLRYDDGTTPINIETLQGGANIPDQQYIREQKIPEDSIWLGVFMRNLTADEFLAQVHNNLGVIFSERKDYEHAASEYAAASSLDHRLPAAYYNHGNDLLAQRDYRRAARLFSRSLRLYPTDVWALNNRGLAYLKVGKQEKARRDFEEALRIDPGFEQARRNLEDLQAPR